MHLSAIVRRGGAGLLSLLLVVGPIAAPRVVAEETVILASSPPRGPVTNLPLPRFVSLKVGEANVRRGPSRAHRIDWVYQRRGLPLEVTAEFGHWRRVRDRDGAGGWIHYSLISGVRTVLIEARLADLRMHPSDSAATVARAEAGVVARLGRCSLDWCRITADRSRGWVPKTALWGVRSEEIRD